MLSPFHDKYMYICSLVTDFSTLDSTMKLLFLPSLPPFARVWDFYVRPLMRKGYCLLLDLSRQIIIKDS